jgi:hydrogenase expression/formation protein HypE
VPHCLRDLTRGGLASGLCELAEAAGCDFEIDEAALPIDGAVQGACEILGLDPWSLASEGRFLAIVAAEQAAEAIERLRGAGDGQGRQAALIGTVSAHAGGAGGAPAGAATTGGVVILRSRLGTRRPLRLPQGEPLPRIC